MLIARKEWPTKRGLGRVPTHNSVRAEHWRTRHSLGQVWRTEFAQIARLLKFPTGLDEVVICVHPFHGTKGVAPDPGSAYDAAKAAIDGLVDYGVLADDSGKHVKALTFYPSDYIAGWEGLEIHVTPLPDRDWYLCGLVGPVGHGIGAVT